MTRDELIKKCLDVLDTLSHAPGSDIKEFKGYANKKLIELTNDVQEIQDEDTFQFLASFQK